MTATRIFLQGGELVRALAQTAVVILIAVLAFRHGTPYPSVVFDYLMLRAVGLPVPTEKAITRLLSGKRPKRSGEKKKKQ